MPCSSLIGFSWQAGFCPANQLSSETNCAINQLVHTYTVPAMASVSPRTKKTLSTPRAVRWQVISPNSSCIVTMLNSTFCDTERKNMGKWRSTFPPQLSQNPNRTFRVGQELHRWRFPSHSTWPPFNSASVGHWRGTLEGQVGKSDVLDFMLGLC